MIIFASLWTVAGESSLCLHAQRARVLIVMANSASEMIFTPRWYAVTQVALIITGQLRSIKDGGPAGFFQSGLGPMFKIAPKFRGHLVTNRRANDEVRSFRIARGSRPTFGSRLRQTSVSANTSTVELVRSCTAGGWSSLGKPRAGPLSRRCRQLGSSSINGSKRRLLQTSERREPTTEVCYRLGATGPFGR